jgi:hypothetical protein
MLIVYYLERIKELYTTNIMVNIENIFTIGVLLIFIFLYIIPIQGQSFTLNHNTVGVLAGFLLVILLFSHIT